MPPCLGFSSDTKVIYPSPVTGAAVPIYSRNKSRFQGTLTEPFASRLRSAVPPPVSRSPTRCTKNKPRLLFLLNALPYDGHIIDENSYIVNLFFKKSFFSAMALVPPAAMKYNSDMNCISRELADGLRGDFRKQRISQFVHLSRDFSSGKEAAVKA